MIDSMLDTEPHLSVHQLNAVFLFVFLPAYGSGLLILCVHVLHENIFIAQHFCAVFIW